MTELAERLPGAQNYQITATEREGEVVFLHRLERGRASKSYGIEVARLAGMPPAALTRAREVLQRLERYELDVFAEEEGEVESERAIAVGASESSDTEDRALSTATTQAARRRMWRRRRIRSASRRSSGRCVPRGSSSASRRRPASLAFSPGGA